MKKRSAECAVESECGLNESIAKPVFSPDFAKPS